MGDGLVHATWNALAPSRNNDDFAVSADRAACSWEHCHFGFDVRALDLLLREGLKDDERWPTCPKCLVMLDWRLENPE